MSRVVVIGAGVGGLACAARLAATGHRVTVCEQADTVGGKLGWYAEAGYGFDTGPSLVTIPEVFTELFSATGRPLADLLDLERLDPACAYRFGDGTTVRLRDRTADSADELAQAFGPATAQGWERLLDHGHRLWDQTRATFVEAPLAGLRSMAGLAVRNPASIGLVAPWRTLRGLGESLLPDPRARMLLDRYATYSGSDPRRAPSALAVIPYLEQAQGSWYVRGGLRGLGLALLERCEALGVEVRTGCDVTEVERRHGRASGVRTADGTHLAADVVVANADATHLYTDLLPPDAARGARRQLSRAPASLSGFVLLLGLRGRTPGLAHHTVLFPDSGPGGYDSEFDAIFRPRGQPSPDPTVYISVPDDPATRPQPDSEAWFVLVNAARHGTGPGQLDWTAPGRREDYTRTVLEVLARRGLDVRDRIEVLRVQTPADLATATRAPGGSIYGTSSSGARAAFLRPANRSPVPGLFLVGGSAHPGGGLPMVATSARIVAGLVGAA